MPNITYFNAQDMQSAIGAANQAVSGMSYAEAVAALGASNQQSGPTVISTFPLLKQTGGTPVSLEAQYAAQTWNYYKTAAQAAGITSLGAAASAGLSWAQGVIMGTGQGLAATGGLLTLSAPVAVAAAAPLLGVGLGVALYESNPELWTKISNKIVGTFGNAITAVMDAAGKIHLPKSLVDKLKEVFDEEGIPTSGSTSEEYEVSSDLQANPYPSVIKVTSSGYYNQGHETNNNTYYLQNGAVGAWFSNSVTILAAANSVYAYKRLYTDRGGNVTKYDTDQLTSSYTYEGRTVYYNIYNTGHIGRDSVLPITYVISGSVQSAIAKAAWIMIYGNRSSAPGEYQPGTSEWEGITPTTIPEVPVYNPETQSTEPYYPVQIPLDVPPGASPDPEKQPDPTAPTPPELIPYIDPYIQPYVDPAIQWPSVIEVPPPEELVTPGVNQDPLYVPAPNLFPGDNPSVIPDSEPAGPLDTNQDPPFSSGQSPDPKFPLPDVPFPSWMPSGSETPVPSGEPGFIQVYNPTGGEFITFGRWLWVTYEDATIEKIWNNPFDGVIGAHELYATPSKDGYSTIRCGFLDSGISSIVVQQRYTMINCGSIVIPEYWGNYLDYSPYSQAMIYLPFIGIVNVDVDDIVGSAVNILYHVDSYTGACIAQITGAKDGYTNTLYQFSGNCAVDIPMAGGTQAQIKAAMMTADAYSKAANIGAVMSAVGGLGSGLASVIGGAMMGNPASLIGGATSGAGHLIGGLASAASQYAYGQAQHTANMLSGKSIVQHSGSFGASHGAMGIKKPYIIIRRPIQKVVNGYNELYGYPAHKQVIIGSCKGYLRCREVHVVSSLATDDEKAKIEQLLVTGVYVTE